MKDLEKNHRIEFSVKKNNRSLENKTFTGLNLNFCESDNDGFLAFDSIEILDQVQLSVASDLDDNDPRVLIGTSEGTFLEVGDILQNPTVTSLCDLVPASFDVAINSNSEIFTTNDSSLVTLFLLILISYYLMIFMQHIHHGNYFELKTMRCLKNMAYILIFIWLDNYTSKFILDKFKNVVNETSETYINVVIQFPNISLLVCGLMLWLVAHIFSHGIILKEENKYTI